MIARKDIIKPLGNPSSFSASGVDVRFQHEVVVLVLASLQVLNFTVTFAESRFPSGNSFAMFALFTISNPLSGRTPISANVPNAKVNKVNQCIILIFNSRCF